MTFLKIFACSFDIINQVCLCGESGCTSIKKGSSSKAFFIFFYDWKSILIRWSALVSVDGWGKKWGRGGGVSVCLSDLRYSLSQRPACHVQHQSCSFTSVLFHPPFPLVLWWHNSLMLLYGKCACVSVCHAHFYTFSYCLLNAFKLLRFDQVRLGKLWFR